MPEEQIYQPKMSVNLAAVQENYDELCRHAPKQEICPVVKSNAYGLGAKEVTESLIKCGCRNFYVSTAQEGIHLRKHFPDIQINVLNGPHKSNLILFKKNALTPVINSMEQLRLWEKICSSSQTGCILNLETGFNRLGIKESEWPHFTKEKLKEYKVSLIMSHLSCASDVPEMADCKDEQRRKTVQEQNKKQFDTYQRALKHFGLPGSLALDAHLANTEQAPISQIRSGAALYGINVFPKVLNLSPVMTIEAPLLQIETIKKGDNVGYGATSQAEKDTKVAVLGIGYSHGIPRSLSNNGKVWFQDGDEFYSAPIIGRISMGLLNCDVTKVPQSALKKSKASLVNRRYTINDFCVDADRLDSEIMCCFNSMDLVYTNRLQREREKKISNITNIKKSCCQR